VGVSPQRCRQVTSWAATVPWRDCADCLPHKTVGTLPPGGIAIQITLARVTSPPPRWMRRIAWPPRVHPADVVAGFEGLPGRIGVYQSSVLVGRYQVAVWAFFGRGRPTPSQLRAANAELAAAHVPAG
jgi:hypothetical protein